MTTLAPSKSQRPTDVFRMNRAKPNWRIIPQITVRHGKSRRLDDIAQVIAMKATMPRTLIRRRGIRTIFPVHESTGLRARVGEPNRLTRRLCEGRPALNNDHSSLFPASLFCCLLCIVSGLRYLRKFRVNVEAKQNAWASASPFAVARLRLVRHDQRLSMTTGTHLAPDVDPAVLPDLADSHLYNADLAPVAPDKRKWRVGSFAALWISMSACIPTYMLASGLVDRRSA